MNDILSNIPIPGALQTELANRGKTSVNQWNAAKAVWVQIESMASTCTSGGIIRSNGDLIYESNFTRPRPNIKSVKVKKLGELGTTRTCTVELQAWTDEQLNEIAQCYFLPGMSVRVQFGWNINASGARVAGPIEGVMPDSAAFCAIEALAAEDACLDGFQGKVANYSYTLNQDAGWDISLEIISPSHFVAETKVQRSSNKCDCKADVGGKEVPVNNSDLMMSLLTALGDGEAIKKQLTKVGLNPSDHYAELEYNGAGRTAFGESSSGFAALADMWDDDLTEPFISVKAFHTLLNRHSIPQVFGKIDTENLVIKLSNVSALYVVSSDVRVCYVPGARYSPDLLDDTGEVPSVPPALVGTNFILNNVLLNVVFLLKCIKDLSDQTEAKKGLPLQTLLSTIYATINTKLGNFFTLEVVDSSGKCSGGTTPSVQVIDVSVSDGGDVLEVEPAGGGYDPSRSIVRDFTLQTKLTDAMKTMALYAYIPNQGTADPCQNKFKAFRQNKAYNRAEPKAEDDKPNGEDVECEIDADGIECENGKGVYTKLSEAIEDLQDECNDDSVAAFESARSAVIADIYENNNVICSTVLPFEFSFTLDGVGGFKFGQYVTHPRIPPGVRSSIKFQVTAVEHEIDDNNDWKTTVNTIARFKSAR